MTEYSAIYIVEFGAAKQLIPSKVGPEKNLMQAVANVMGFSNRTTLTPLVICPTEHIEDIGELLGKKLELPFGVQKFS